MKGECAVDSPDKKAARILASASWAGQPGWLSHTGGGWERDVRGGPSVHSFPGGTVPAGLDARPDGLRRRAGKVLPQGGLLADQRDAVPTEHGHARLTHRVAAPVHVAVGLQPFAAVL